MARLKVLAIFVGLLLLVCTGFVLVLVWLLRQLVMALLHPGETSWI